MGGGLSHRKGGRCLEGSCKKKHWSGSSGQRHGSCSRRLVSAELHADLQERFHIVLYSALTKSTCACVEMPSMSRSRSRLTATSLLMDRVLGFERYRNHWFFLSPGASLHPCGAVCIQFSQRRTGQRHAISTEFHLSPSNGVVFELVSCLFLLSGTMASLSGAAVHNLMEGKCFLVVVAVTQQAVECARNE